MRLPRAVEAIHLPADRAWPADAVSGDGGCGRPEPMPDASRRPPVGGPLVFAAGAPIYFTVDLNSRTGCLFESKAVAQRPEPV